MTELDHVIVDVRPSLRQSSELYITREFSAEYLFYQRPNSVARGFKTKVIKDKVGFKFIHLAQDNVMK